MVAMSNSPRIKSRRLQIEMWVYVTPDHDLPPPRIVADGIVEGLGDAWFGLDDGDEHAVSTHWQADYIGDQHVG